MKKHMLSLALAISIAPLTSIFYNESYNFNNIKVSKNGDVVFGYDSILDLLENNYNLKNGLIKDLQGNILTPNKMVMSDDGKYNFEWNDQFTDNPGNQLNLITLDNKINVNHINFDDLTIQPSINRFFLSEEFKENKEINNNVFFNSKDGELFKITKSEDKSNIYNAVSLKIKADNVLFIKNNILFTWFNGVDYSFYIYNKITNSAEFINLNKSTRDILYLNNYVVVDNSLYGFDERNNKEYKISFNDGKNGYSLEEITYFNEKNKIVDTVFEYENNLYFYYKNRITEEDGDLYSYSCNDKKFSIVKDENGNDIKVNSYYIDKVYGLYLYDGIDDYIYNIPKNSQTHSDAKKMIIENSNSKSNVFESPFADNIVGNNNGLVFAENKYYDSDRHSVIYKLEGLKAVLIKDLSSNIIDSDKILITSNNDVFAYNDYISANSYKIKNDVAEMIEPKNNLNDIYEFKTNNRDFILGTSEDGELINILNGKKILDNNKEECRIISLKEDVLLSNSGIYIEDYMNENIWIYEKKFIYN